MYICRECGNKFAQKVEYCDCGNDSFDYVEQKKKQKKNSLTIEQKGKIFSKIFLLICILLSIIVWIIPVKEDKPVTKPESSKTEIKIIPSIDKIWDDTPVIEKKEEIVILNETPIPLTPIPDYAKPKIQKENKKTEQPKRVTQNNNNATSKKQNVKPIESTQNIKKNTNSNTSNLNKPLKDTNKVKTSKPVAETNKSVVEQNKIVNQQNRYNPNSPEMLKYKGSLRAAMFSKFAVGSITGSGTCSVQFSVDPTGKLINRSFSKQSDNKSLNDAVYYMMMSVPRFSPPPSGYNGETIRMNFKINNGEYEISIY